MRISIVYILVLTTGLQLLRAEKVWGQTAQNTMVNIGARHISLKEVLGEISDQTSFMFVFPPALLDEYTDVSIAGGSKSVKKILDEAMKDTPLAYREMGKNIVVFHESSGINNADLFQDAGTVVTENNQTNVSGRVTDPDSNVGLPGVSIIIKGTTQGTTTNADGYYVIDAAQEDILIFSFVGFKTIETSVGGRSIIDVAMNADVRTLDIVEVRSTGYWEMTKEESTGSISKVTSKDIETRPVSSPLLALQGQMAGVDITPRNGTPGSAVKVQIRGQNSLRAGGGGDADGNLPLYIIDGVPIDSRPILPVSTTLIGVGFDPLASISPENIESIEVLKDADATAIYGSRGANGVILITTKNGRKADKINLSVDFYKGVGEISKKVDVLNTAQYVKMRKEALKNDNVVPGTGIFPDHDLVTWDTTRYTDWQDILIGRTAQILDVQPSISGGNANTSFRISGGFHKETMVFPTDLGLQRSSGAVSLNHISPNGKVSVMLSANYGLVKNKLINDANILATSIGLPPNAPNIFDAEGNLNWENSTWSNPYSSFRKVQESEVRNLVVNGVFGYEFFPDVNFKLNVGYSDLNGTEYSEVPISSYDPKWAAYYVGVSNLGNNSRNSYLLEPQVDYKKSIGSGNSVSAVLGMTVQESNYFSQSILLDGFTSDALLGNAQAAGSTIFERNTNSQYRYGAIFGRIGFDFQDRYFLNLTGRRDGSSRYGPDNRYANFGALGIAWIFSREKFFENTRSILSFGKIRGSYGTTGNDQIGDYKYIDTYNLNTVRYQNFPAITPTALFNPSYAWEVTRKLEAAVELGFFDNRITLDVNRYRNRSSNQIVQKPLPYTTGFPSILANLDATIENFGWEFVCRTENIRKHGKFSWTSSVNVSIPRSKLIRFDNIEQSNYSAVYSIGQPLSIVKLYKYTGVNSETGLYDYFDYDGDAAISFNDKKFEVDLGRQYYGGLSNTFSFANFELFLLVQFSKQKAVDVPMNTLPGLSGNQPVKVMERWIEPGNNVRIQKFSQNIFGPAYPSYANYLVSSESIVDGSFVRLKSVSVSYAFPYALVSRIGLQSLRIYMESQNLVTFTGYKGWDPETGMAMPPLRMFTIGIQSKI
jgi:TonB-linked SusC/RagA family outer membrane protein